MLSGWLDLPELEPELEPPGQPQLEPDATLDDLREAVTNLEEIAPTARRVLGGAHPITVEVERNLGDVRAALRARETPPPAGGQA